LHVRRPAHARPHRDGRVARPSHVACPDGEGTQGVGKR
jgi:hypothetical protein